MKKGKNYLKLENQTVEAEIQNLQKALYPFRIQMLVLSKSYRRWN